MDPFIRGGTEWKLLQLMYSHDAVLFAECTQRMYYSKETVREVKKKFL